MMTAASEELITLIFRYLLTHPSSRLPTEIEVNAKLPEDVYVVVGIMLMESSHAAVAAAPWPNSTVQLPTEIVPASVDPIVGIKITAARPSAILRLRVLFFFFFTGSSSEPKFKVFISYLLFLVYGFLFFTI